MQISFRNITDFPRGTLCSMLNEAYSFDPRCARDWDNDWREFDDFFFDRPVIADRCGFITVADEAAAGFISWDPRRLPEYVQIGHNCIIPKFKGRGYGKLQLLQAVTRISAECPARIIVTTSEIMIPAQRMYERVGFRCVRRRENPHFSGKMIDYELVFSRNEER